jgi:hypothetical protein
LFSTLLIIVRFHRGNIGSDLRAERDEFTLVSCLCLPEKQVK